MNLHRGWCLVLSGGGAKGVYHLGVWKALKELDLRVDALVGTSIGALAAALLAQGAEDALETLVASLSFDSIVHLPKGADLASLRDLTQQVLQKGGLDTSPLRTWLDEKVDEDAIRRSGLDVGLVTINLSELTPREVFLDAITPGQLVDYLMASSAFPGFEPPVIEGRRYLDGGLHDNVPYGVARRRGWKRLIVSDISGLGRNRRPDPEGAVTAWIRVSVKMGGVLDFDRTFLDQYQALGHLDTLRTFGVLGGRWYFLEPGDPVPEGLEEAALVADVPRFRRWTVADLHEAVVRARRSIDDELTAQGEGEGRALLRTVEALRTAPGPAWRTWRLLELLFPGRTGTALRRSLVGWHPALAKAVTYRAG